MAKPFIKWAGGKTSNLPAYQSLYPDFSKIKRYVEPFLGGGAVFFDVYERLADKPVILLDDNAELINVYKIVRDQLSKLIKKLNDHKLHHSKSYYYEIRDVIFDPFDSIKRAARFIYLNKTCFNGLYRVNRNGKFNVPFGQYDNPSIFDEVNLQSVCATLQNAKLLIKDFSDLYGWVEKGDFVYLDPPYHKVSKSSFTSYTANSFTDSDHFELNILFDKLNSMGCKVMLSNSNTSLIRKLYKKWNIVEVETRRSISANGAKREKVKDLVIRNY